MVMSETVCHCFVILISNIQLMLKDAKLFSSFLLYEQKNVFCQRFVREIIVTIKFSWTSPLRYLWTLLFTFVRIFTITYLKHILLILFFRGSTDPSGPMPLMWGFSITLKHATLSRTPLGEWSARRRNLYLTTHSTHERQTSMLPAGFELAIPASKRPQTHVLDCAATGIATDHVSRLHNFASILWLHYRVV
jgi:hypothetical protein